MKLNVMERLVLRGLLPENGTFVTYKAVRGLHEMLAFDEDEVQSLGLKQEDGQITWDSSKEVPREFPFNKTQLDVIDVVLKELDSKGKIDAHTFPLFEKFIEGKED